MYAQPALRPYAAPRPRPERNFVTLWITGGIWGPVIWPVGVVALLVGTAWHIVFATGAVAAGDIPTTILALVQGLTVFFVVFVLNGRWSGYKSTIQSYSAIGGALAGLARQLALRVSSDQAQGAAMQDIQHLVRSIPYATKNLFRRSAQLKLKKLPMPTELSSEIAQTMGTGGAVNSILFLIGRRAADLQQAGALESAKPVDSKLDGVAAAVGAISGAQKVGFSHLITQHLAYLMGLFFVLRPVALWVAYDRWMLLPFMVEFFLLWGMYAIAQVLNAFDSARENLFIDFDVGLEAHAQAAETDRILDTVTGQGKAAAAMADAKPHARQRKFPVL